MLTLYYTPGACSMAAHIVLEESGDEYEARKVDLAGGEQRTEAYLKINPLGRSPRGASAPRRSDEANHRNGDPSLPAARVRRRGGRRLVHHPPTPTDSRSPTSIPGGMGGLERRPVRDDARQ